MQLALELLFLKPHHPRGLVAIDPGGSQLVLIASYLELAVLNCVLVVEVDVGEVLVAVDLGVTRVPLKLLLNYEFLRFALVAARICSNTISIELIKLFDAYVILQLLLLVLRPREHMLGRGQQLLDVLVLNVA